MRLQLDPIDGAALIEGRPLVPGQRVVWETLNDAGEHVYVVRRPRDRSAPAEFEVLVEDYTENEFGRIERADDAPWIKVRQVVVFATTIGTGRS